MEQTNNEITKSNEIETNNETNNHDETNGAQARRTKTETLCWTCAHCTCAKSNEFLHLSKTLSNGSVVKQFSCPWASSGEQVPGWDATPRIIKSATGESMNTFFVNGCPHYKADIEATVSSMSCKELKRLLGLSQSFCEDHRKFVNKIAISYIREMNEMREVYKKDKMAYYPKTKDERFAVRKAIVRQYKYYLENDLEDILKISDNSETAEIRVAKTELKLCDTAIKTMSRIQKSGFYVRRNNNACVNQT